MAELTAAAAAGQPVAVIGLACRFPDADDPAALLDTVLAGRRAFRRLPPCRIDLADYYSADPRTQDATYSTRAALLEGWQFDRAAFGIGPAEFLAADPAHWLALETAARALAGAGFPGGKGLNRDRVGVIIGNSLGGDTSRASAMRLRWPYVRRIVADALYAADIPAEHARQVLRNACAGYLAPFPAVGEDTLAGGMPGVIAARICGYFGFRGAAAAVDGAGASALQAVAAACAALSAGDLDVALAGGVDISLDPLELVGLAKAGALAADQMRVYDVNPTGYLPGEGCGVVLLMRAADAQAADLPVYAQISGWGTSADAGPSAADARAALVLALRRAYQRAAIDPVDVQLIEGHGSGIAADDEAELAALAELRAGARTAAALGSIKANIGHTKAAAGAAGLIKTVLAVSTGVIPPATGTAAPHPLLREAGGRLCLPESAQDWPAGPRIAGVSAMGPGGSNVHLVLGKDFPRADRPRRTLPRRGRDRSADRAAPVEVSRPPAEGPARLDAYLLQAAEPAALAEPLAAIAGVARWLSDAELADLAVQLARAAAQQGPARIAIVASRQEQLARLAGEAIGLLPELTGGQVAVRPGIFAADGAGGRVTLLLPDEQVEPGAVPRSLDAIRWLDRLGVRASAAVAHGLGHLTALAWAGCIIDADVAMLTALPPKTRSDPEQLRSAVRQLQPSPPLRRLISARTGAELVTSRDIIDLVAAALAGNQAAEPRVGLDFEQAVQLNAALTAGATDANLLLETGPGQALVTAAFGSCPVAGVSLGEGPRDERDAARAVAALFAAGALGRPDALVAGRSARPIDIRRERVFITSPCQVSPELPAAAQPAAAQPPAAQPAAARPAAASGPLPDSPPRTQPAAAGNTAGPASAAAGPPAQAPSGAVTLTVTGPEISPKRAISGPPRQAPEPGLHQLGPDGTGERETGERESELSDPGQHGTEKYEIAASSATGRRTARLEPLAAFSAEPAGGQRRGASSAEPAGGQRHGASSAEPADGVAPWLRCFAEELRPPRRPVPPGSDQPWRVRRARGLPFEADVDDLFRDDPGAGQVLAIIGDPAGQESCVTAVRAARDAIGAGGLVVISPEPGLAGLWASLHAEHPALGITVLRVPGTADGLRMAREHAAVIPGELRELVIDAAGEVCEPVMAPAEVPGGAALPLGPGDVVLIGRGGGGAALALAQAAACCGAAVAVIGQPDPDEGADLAPGLDQLRAAGARVGCELIDITDAAELDAAVLRIEQVLGPVTAVGYAAEAGGAVPIAELTEAGLRAQVVAQTAGLGHLLSAVGTEGLRLIVTSGSVAGRYGLAGASLLAVAGGSLAQQARRLADAIPGCQALHVDWPSWAGPDTPGQRAAGGVDPITVRDGSRMLIKLLGTPALPARLAVHGRVGVPAPQALAGPPGADPVAAWTGAGRFTSDVRLHYPGIELICEARLSLQTDPYLADYRMDGISVLPPALALEAMAQVASALTGRALRQATGVSIRAPIVIPEAAAAGQALIRICALRVRDVVQVVVRCAESGYGIEHYRAAFAASAEPAAAAPDAQQAGPAAADAGADGTDADWTGVSAQAAAGIVDGTELYGPICFPSGRFRRIAVLTEVTSRSCRAVARGGDDQPWFSGVGDVRLLLGSPGLADATLQVLQACVPHRNLLPAGCESVTFSGRSAEGAVRIEAAAVAPGPVARVPAPRPTPEPASTAMVPPQAASPEDDRPTGRTPGADGAGAGAAGAGAAGAGAAGAGAAGAGAAGAAVAGAGAAGAAGAGATRPAAGAGGDDPARDDPILAQAWDVRALDRAGQPLIIWRGVRMRDAGPMPRNAAWPPPLLAIYLERVCVELGLDPGLRVAMRRAQPPGDDPGTPSGSHGEAGPEGGSGEQAEAPGGPGGGAPEPAEPAGTANGQGQLAGFTLSVRIAGAAGSAACGWSVAEAGPLAEPDADQAYPAARAQMLSGFLGEPPATVGARLRAIARCLVMAGAPAGCPIAIRDIADDGWILLSAVGAIMACTVADIGGVSAPVAIALMTGTPTWDRNAGPGQAARSAQRAPARS